MHALRKELAIQALGVISALLIIRLLPVDEYAQYTLAISFLMTAVGLADGGVAVGVMAEGGKVWSRRPELANVVATGIAIRRTFAPWVALVCIPAMLWMLRRHGAAWPQCLMITASVTVAFLASLSSSVLEVPLKLRQELRPLQRVQLGAAVMRTALVGAAMGVLSWATSALAANAVTQVWTTYRLRNLSMRSAEPEGVADAQIRAAILRVVRLTLPGVIYYSVSGQLTVWLLSFFGTTEAIAQVGALSRLAAILAIFSSLVAIVATPRFARLSDERSLLLGRYLMVLAATIGAAALICLLVWRYPDATLAVLGPQYKGLREESLLVALSSGLSLVANTMAGLAASRGLIVRPLIGIPLGVAVNAIAIAVSDVSTSLGVLTMATGLAAFSATYATAVGVLLIVRHSKQAKDSGPHL